MLGGFVGSVGRRLRILRVDDDVIVADLVQAARAVLSGLVTAGTGVKITAGTAAGVVDGVYNAGGAIAIAVASTLRGFFDGNGFNGAALLSKLTVTGGPVKVTPLALVSASAHIAWDATSAAAFKHTFTENTTLDNPTNLAEGMGGVFVFTQHAGAAKSLTLGNAFKANTGGAPDASALGLSKRALLTWKAITDTEILYTWVAEGA